MLLFILLGFILGVLFFVRDYKIIIIGKDSFWDTCVRNRNYAHLIFQGVLSGSAGSMFGILMYGLKELLLKWLNQN